MERSTFPFLAHACSVAAALALGLPLAAQAEVRGSFRLEDFGWTVVDLNPNDGMAAGVTFETASFLTGLTAGVYRRGVDANGDPLPNDTGLSRSWSTGNVVFPNGGRSLSQPGSQATARMGGQAASGTYDIVMEGQGSRATALAGQHSAFETFGGMSGDIVLAPLTELVWTGRLSMFVEKTGVGAGMRHEHVEARFRMEMESEDPIFQARHELELDTRGRAPGRLSHEESLRLVFTNRNPYVLPASFEMSLGVQGYSSANPVPEPGTVALMLAGLGVVGVAARRGKR
ncbi:PEP-CTERM sorting domain-containing protein [Azohydromonas australica]|uniref:PEP-CTERM sorting domain-containing protein n=1 Tax=Azohydromonas australica TaxID=364039 RepID=UPI0004214760|nr:PEP-CTERM sorting domain-containing protein [Azohydromonas australica]